MGDVIDITAATKRVKRPPLRHRLKGRPQRPPMLMSDERGREMLRWYEAMRRQVAEMDWQSFACWVEIVLPGKGSKQLLPELDAMQNAAVVIRGKRSA